jgi:hypothetical protein
VVVTVQHMVRKDDIQVAVTIQIGYLVAGSG